MVAVVVVPAKKMVVVSAKIITVVWVVVVYVRVSIVSVILFMVVWLITISAMCIVTVVEVTIAVTVVIRKLLFSWKFLLSQLFFCTNFDGCYCCVMLYIPHRLCSLCRFQRQ